MKPLADPSLGEREVEMSDSKVIREGACLAVWGPRFTSSSWPPEESIGIES